MERPGEKLKRARERLQLTYRDVAEASRVVALRRGSDEFLVALSRLADIENKGTVPTIYRIYTLCAVYRLEFQEVLRWYGVSLDEMLSDAARVRLKATHAVHFAAESPLPQPEDGSTSPQSTTLLRSTGGRWGTLPLSFLSGVDPRHLQFGFIGLEDWSMYPILQPGSLVVIDQSRNKVSSDGWTDEHDRPIYFLEHRRGYLCGWCALTEGRLVVQTHPASQQPPQVFELSEIDVVGQVTGLATVLESKKRRSARTSAVPPRSPNP